MSVANSLQFLEDKYGINVPQAHAQGLRGDNTLVGKLDDYMNRNVPVPGDRTKGGGVHPKNMLSGKFAYLAANGLANKLVHKHQGTGLTLGPGDPDGDSIPAADYTASGITSKFDGARPTWEWIYEQIRSGEDVEISINWANAAGNWAGAHNVRVFGAGITKGKKWIKYKHDREQTDIDPADNKGLEEVEVEVGDIDGDGLLNFGGKKHEISFALSESPARKPTPGTNRHSKDGYFPDQNPTGHTFHELYPVYCRNWVVDQWWDNGDGILSYCDTIRFRNQGNQSTSLEHIEDITTTITVTRLQDTAYYDYVYGNPRMVSIVPRAGDLWHEVWPQYCRMYELLEWLDNGTEVLDSCDYLVFKSLSPPDSGTIDTVHVEGVATDLITSQLSCCVKAGNANHDAVKLVNIQDVTYLINFLYKGGPKPPCQGGVGRYPEGDANGNGITNIADVTYLIKFLYQGGPAPICGPM
ncbi:MAG: hypothetical protein NT002_11415 [candidate division Zixibacteria bacterium]|nr:hypothetical protein [candidate division Zixibacteria bacterium]